VGDEDEPTIDGDEDAKTAEVAGEQAKTEEAKEEEHEALDLTLQKSEDEPNIDGDEDAKTAEVAGEQAETEEAKEEENEALDLTLQESEASQSSPDLSRASHMLDESLSMSRETASLSVCHFCTCFRPSQEQQQSQQHSDDNSFPDTCITPWQQVREITSQSAHDEATQSHGEQLMTISVIDRGWSSFSFTCKYFIVLM
jgi:hypothetical protein